MRRSLSVAAGLQARLVLALAAAGRWRRSSVRRRPSRPARRSRAAARHHRQLGLGGSRGLALPDDHGAEGRHREHPAQRRGQEGLPTRGTRPRTSRRRQVQGLRCAEPDAGAVAVPHLVGRRRDAEDRQRRRPADAPAPVRGPKRRRAPSRQGLSIAAGRGARRSPWRRAACCPATCRATGCLQRQRHDGGELRRGEAAERRSSGCRSTRSSYRPDVSSGTFVRSTTSRRKPTARSGTRSRVW